MSAHSKSQKNFVRKLKLKLLAAKYGTKTKKMDRNRRSYGKKIQLAFWKLLIEHRGIEPEEKLQQFCAKIVLS